MQKRQKNLAVGLRRKSLALQHRLLAKGTVVVDLAVPRKSQAVARHRLRSAGRGIDDGQTSMTEGDARTACDRRGIGRLGQNGGLGRKRDAQKTRAVRPTVRQGLHHQRADRLTLGPRQGRTNTRNSAHRKLRRLRHLRDKGKQRLQRSVISSGDGSWVKFLLVFSSVIVILLQYWIVLHHRSQPAIKIVWFSKADHP